MDKPKVTFLMLAYNKENEVERAIKSVLGQTEQNVALFIRDNGSTDRTRDICREYAEKDARVRLVRNEVNCRKDGGGSFNDGCVTRYWTPLPDDIVGEYVSIIDSDDYLEPDFVEKLYAVANTIKAEIAVSGSSFFDEKGVVFNKRLPPPVCTRRLSRDSEVFRSNLPAMYNTFRTWWGKLFRTDFFMKYYDEAWSTISGSEYWWGAFDTLIMLRYTVNPLSVWSSRFIISFCCAPPPMPTVLSDGCVLSRRRLSIMRATVCLTIFMRIPVKMTCFYCRLTGDIFLRRLWRFKDMSNGPASHRAGCWLELQPFSIALFSNIISAAMKRRFGRSCSNRSRQPAEPGRMI